MKAIAVVGTKKTGKTTMVTALVRSLAKHGRVGTIKNMVSHPVDRGDTRCHFDAGADVVIGLGDARLKVTRERGDLDDALCELQANGVDYAVVEGFKYCNLPKILMSDLDVSNVLKKVKLSELNESMVLELTKLIMELEDYRIETNDKKSNE